MPTRGAQPARVLERARGRLGLGREVLHLRCENCDHPCDRRNRRVGRDLCGGGRRGADRALDVGQQLIELLLCGLSIRGVRWRNCLDLRAQLRRRRLGLGYSGLQRRLRDRAGETARDALDLLLPVGDRATNAVRIGLVRLRVGAVTAACRSQAQDQDRQDRDAFNPSPGVTPAILARAFSRRAQTMPERPAGCLIPMA